MRIDDSTSSAMAPAEAYCFCSLLVNVAASLASTAPLKAMKGTNAIRRRVRRHSWEKPTAKPAKKVVSH